MKQGKPSKISRPGCKGDPRMNRAVAARLRDPELPLFHALRLGGFDFPANEDASTLDNDKITLGQRKNQLSRRLRAIRKQEDAAKEESMNNYAQVQEGEVEYLAVATKKGVVSQPHQIDPLAVYLQKESERAAREYERGMKRSAQHLEKHAATNDILLQDLNLTEHINEQPKRQALFHPISNSLLDVGETGRVEAPSAHPEQKISAAQWPFAVPGRTPNQIVLPSEMMSIIARNASVDPIFPRELQAQGAKLTVPGPAAATLLLNNDLAAGGAVFGGGSLFPPRGVAATITTSAAATALGVETAKERTETRNPQAASSGDDAQTRETIALQLFRQELQTLYRRSMLSAGYSSQETSQRSPQFRRFAFFAWKNECERLQEILGDADARTFSSPPHT